MHSSLESEEMPGNDQQTIETSRANRFIAEKERELGIAFEKDGSGHLRLVQPSSYSQAISPPQLGVTVVQQDTISVSDCDSNVRMQLVI